MLVRKLGGCHTLYLFISAFGIGTIPDQFVHQSPSPSRRLFFTADMSLPVAKSPPTPLSLFYAAYRHKLFPTQTPRLERDGSPSWGRVPRLSFVENSPYSPGGDEQGGRCEPQELCQC